MGRATGYAPSALRGRESSADMIVSGSAAAVEHLHDGVADGHVDPESRRASCWIERDVSTPSAVPRVSRDRVAEATPLPM